MGSSCTPSWGRRDPDQFWSIPAGSVDTCTEVSPTNHAQLQQIRKTKQQLDSSLEISLLRSLKYLHVIEQSQTSVCDTTAYKKFDIPHLLRNSIFLLFTKKLQNFCVPCRDVPKALLCPVYQCKYWETVGKKKVIWLWGPLHLVEVLLHFFSKWLQDWDWVSI